MAHHQGRRRGRRVLGAAAALLASAVTFVGTAAVSLVLHLDAPPAKRLAAEQLNKLLAGTFQGRIVLERIDHLGLDGVGGVRARILDPEGQQVLFVDALSARISVLDAARSALLGEDDLELTVTDLELAHADVSLDADGAGELRLARTFEPREPSAPEDPNARPVRFEIERARIHHAWVHGQMQGAPAIDADLQGLAGSVEVEEERTRIEVASLYLFARGMPQGLDPRGDVEGKLELPSDGPLAVEASFDGDVAGIPVSAAGVMDGDYVDARAEVHEVSGERVRAVIADAPVFDAVGADIEVSGTLPVLDVSALVQIGRGVLGASAQVGIGDTIWVDGTARARNIDVRAFSPTAPRSDIGGDVDVDVSLGEDGLPYGSVGLHSLPGTMAGQSLPAIHARADLAGQRIRGDARIHEPGAPTHLRWDMRPQGGSRVVDFELESRAPRLEAVSRLGAAAHGRAAVNAKGRVDLTSSTVTAKLSATASDLRVDQASARSVDLTASAEGPLADPRIAASVKSSNVDVAGYRFVGVEAGAEGPVSAPRLRLTADGPDLPRIGASLQVRTAPQPAAHDVRVVLTRGGERALVSADRIGPSGQALDVRGLVIEGLGDPVRADLTVGQHTTVVRAKTDNLDLARVARLANVQDKIRSGRASFDVDLTVRRHDVRGDVRLDVADAAIGRVQGAAAHFDARLLGRRLHGNASVRAGKAIAVYVNTSTMEIGGSPLEPRSWRTATGAVQLDADVDLAKVVELIPREMLPVGELSGHITAEGELSRDKPQDHPALDLSVRTQNLLVAGLSPQAGQVDHTPVVEKPPWRLAGLDVDVDARLDGERETAAVKGRLLDKRGTITEVDATARIGVRDLLNAPEGAAARLERTPFHVTIEVPRRALSTLPPMFKMTSTKGSMEAKLEASGTALEPEVHGTLALLAVRDQRLNLDVPADALVALDYARGLGEAKVSVRLPHGEVLAARSEVHAKVADLLHPPANGDPPWDASLDAKMQRLPLHAIGAIADTDVRGHVSGELGLSDLHKNAKANAKIDIDDLRVGSVHYSGGFVNASIDETGLRADARLEQKDGYAQASARMGARWGAELAPSLDPNKPADITLQAKEFRAAAFRPFVEETLSQLDGRLDGNARIHVGAHGAHPTMSGTLTLRRGLFQVRTVGQEFRNTRARLVFHDDGTIRLEQFETEGVTGRLQAAAAARFDGLKFVGARARVRIPEHEPVPLTVEGEQLGEIAGNVDLTAKMSPDQKRMDVNVYVPKLRTRLPDFSAREVQKLEPAEHIRIGTYRAPPQQFVLVPLGPPTKAHKITEDPLQVFITIDLRDVEVRRGTNLKVRLRGKPTIEVGDEPKVRGQIQLVSGIIEVQGKRFTIERGTVTFVGDDPANPEVLVTASWEAPDRSKIYADFVGPLETGKVTLRSEPPRPQSEILSLIVFGTADGAGGTPAPGQEPDGTTRAVGLGGGFATKGLNAALDDLTDIDISTRVDTTNSANPRPELMLQISRDVSVALAYVLGVPPPGSNPDKTFVILDWRFASNWSFQTTVGDRGSSIFDVIWRKRY